ncbi:hypothetical protein VTL71DRAFT_14521 [Oculimacula yallundae]|uniref:Uncharacterized protein n=1 Tax=Oculimacula yallundae TaxID=86028 RepID=A0ABR4CK08_9HELO
MPLLQLVGQVKATGSWLNLDRKQGWQLGSGPGKYCSNRLPLLPSLYPTAFFFPTFSSQIPDCGEHSGKLARALRYGLMFTAQSSILWVPYPFFSSSIVVFQEGQGPGLQDP